jgi:hypothetical protein
MVSRCSIPFLILLSSQKSFSLEIDAIDKQPGFYIVNLHLLLNKTVNLEQLIIHMNNLATLRIETRGGKKMQAANLPKSQTFITLVLRIERRQGTDALSSFHVQHLDAIALVARGGNHDRWGSHFTTLPRRLL